jgi:signal transduction histidine kinase
MLCVSNENPYLLSSQQLLTLEVLGNHLAKLIDLKVARKQLEKTSQQIALQNRLQKKMHSVIVHDIRGPIGSILSAFQMLESEEIAEEERKMLISIFAKQIGTTFNLVNNLIDWGTIEMQEKSVKQEVNLKEIVDQEFEQVRLSAEAKNNQLTNLVNKAASITINPNMLRFMIRNLVTNANKFTHNGRISVYNDVAETYHRIAISDTGVGMAPEIINKIVSTENVVTTTGTNDEKGSGMGITLIKDFIKEIGGEISIQSNIGKGTTVFLKIPM